jgi:hypothetical protein
VTEEGKEAEADAEAECAREGCAGREGGRTVCFRDIYRDHQRKHERRVRGGRERGKGELTGGAKKSV